MYARTGRPRERRGEAGDGGGVRVSGRRWRWAGTVHCLKVKDREKERGGGQGEGQRGGAGDVAWRWTREGRRGAAEAQLVRGMAWQGGKIAKAKVKKDLEKQNMRNMRRVDR